LSCSSFSPSSVVEWMGSSIAIIAALSQGRTCGSLFHLTVHDVIADYHIHTHTRDHKNTNITTPDVNTAMSLGTLPYQDWRSL
jgi:hypothetical protein